MNGSATANIARIPIRNIGREPERKVVNVFAVVVFIVHNLGEIRESCYIDQFHICDRNKVKTKRGKLNIRKEFHNFLKDFKGSVFDS